MTYFGLCALCRCGMTEPGYTCPDGCRRLVCWWCHRTVRMNMDIAADLRAGNVVP